jgi:hypothetical protein
MPRLKAKPVKGKPEADKSATAAHRQIAVVKSTAISANVGPTVLALLDTANRNEEKYKELRQDVQDKRYDAMAALTMGIVKAAKADGSIDLTPACSDKHPGMARLNDQLGLALDFKEVVTLGEGAKAKQAIRYNGRAAKFVSPGKDATDLEKRRANTLRSNFVTMVKKCAQAAEHILTEKVVAKADQKAGTLLLSGPSIKREFGADSVLLDGKQTVEIKNKKGEVVGEKKLKAKPSFQALADRAAAAHGKITVARGGMIGGRVDSRKQQLDPASYIASVAKVFIQACERIKGQPSEDTKRSLESVRSAIDKCLGD